MARVLHDHGLEVSQIITRDSVVGSKLAQEVQAVYSPNPDSLFRDASLVFLTVPDHALESIKTQLPDGDYSLIHVSGTTALDVITDKGKHQGVFYPLQSFTKHEIPTWSSIPVFVEATDSDLQDTLIRLVSAFAAKAYVVDSAVRSKIHLSAVFASNFTNHLIDIAQQMVTDAALPQEILHPLLRVTLDRAIQVGARSSQTGPAKRGDQQTIEKHLELLSFKEIEKDMYRLLSDSVRRRYNID